MGESETKRIARKRGFLYCWVSEIGEWTGQMEQRDGALESHPSYIKQWKVTLKSRSSEAFQDVIIELAARVKGNQTSSISLSTLNAGIFDDKYKSLVGKNRVN